MEYKAKCHVAFNDRKPWPLIVAREDSRNVTSHSDFDSSGSRDVLELHFYESDVKFEDMLPYFTDPDSMTSILTIVDEAGNVFTYPNYVIPVQLAYGFEDDDPNKRVILYLGKLTERDKILRAAVGMQKVYTGTELEIAIEKRIDALDKRCEEIVYGGFDIPLSSGESKHFNFGEQDQANLTGLAAEVLIGGSDKVMWHTDNQDEPCEFYSIDDFKNIIGILSLHKKFNITYFRDLRRYIRSLSTLEQVAATWYGMPIPEEFYSDTLTKVIEDFGPLFEAELGLLDPAIDYTDLNEAIMKQREAWLKATGQYVEPEAEAETDSDTEDTEEKDSEE